MYGLPEDFDGSFFVGRMLQTVAFSPDMVQLIFDENVSIGVQSSYEYRFGSEQRSTETQQLEHPITTSRLMQLLGKRIQSLEVERQGTLTLHFEQGHIFRCFDDDPGYESYSIRHGTEELFV